MLPKRSHSLTCRRRLTWVLFGSEKFSEVPIFSNTFCNTHVKT